MHRLCAGREPASTVSKTRARSRWTPCPQHTLKRQLELSRSERLLENLGGAGVPRALDHRRAEISAHEQDRNGGSERAHSANELGPRRTGDAFIGDDGIELFGICQERLDCLRAGSKADCRVSQ